MARNWAAVAIALTLVSLGLFAVMLLAKYVRICLNIFQDTPPWMLNPLDFQPIHGEMVRFRSFDGTSLRGMYIATPNKTQRKGAILFCHEFGSDMFSCARYTRPLIEAGFDVFTFDYRGHGESSLPGKYKPLQWPSDKEMEDTLGASAYLQERLVEEGRSPEIGVFGISRGAGSALLAASSDRNIKAIVCDGAFCTDICITGFMKRWADIFARVRLVYRNHPDAFWKFLAWLLMRFAQPKLGCRFPSVRKALRDMKSRPILFIHGQRDSYIRLEQTEVLVDAAPDPNYLWVCDKAKHNQSVVVEPRQYAHRTRAFFLKHLAGEPIPDDDILAPAETEVA